MKDTALLKEPILIDEDPNIPLVKSIIQDVKVWSILKLPVMSFNNSHISAISYGLIYVNLEL